MRTFQRNVKMTAKSGKGRVHERVLFAYPGLGRCIYAVAQLGMTAIIWPRFVAPFRWSLTRYDMPLENLDPAFDGFRILQLTDLHVGKTRISYLERVVDATLAEKPDLVVITGDLIDYHPHALPLIGPLLKRITAAAGTTPVCAIFGNHDYNEYSWRHNGPRSARRIIHRRLIQQVLDAGIRPLKNEQLTITRTPPHQPPARLTLVGLDEMWTGLADAPRAFAGLTSRDAVICLQHNPDGIEFLQPFPWQYMLCGHSHGGQALLPLLGAMFVPMEHREYLQGFFQFPPLPGQTRPRTMFVSRGLGYSYPIRLLCPPEATLFTLKHA